MATVTLSWLTLNLASDLSQVWSFPMMSSLQSSPTTAATSRLYAGGNWRQVTTPGRQSSLAVTVSAATADDRQALEFDLLGQTLCVRDDRGRKFYGFYNSPQVAEHQFDDECEITLTFSEVTVSEAA